MYFFLQKYWVPKFLPQSPFFVGHTFFPIFVLEKTEQNMKKSLPLLALSIVLSFTAMSQLEFHYNGVPAPETLHIDSADVNSMTYSDYFIKKMHVVNTSNQPVQLEFKRIRRYHKYGWLDQVCDDFLCFTADDANVWLRPTDQTNILTINPGDSSVFQPKVFPKTIAGCSIYTYQVTNSFGVVYDTVQISYSLGGFSCNLSAEEYENEIEYSVYPNPASDVLTINIGQSNNTSSISIYNLVGEEVSTMVLNNGNNFLDVSALSSGVYFYAIKSNNTVIETKKLVIQ